jgi:hypothetical protein
MKNKIQILLFTLNCLFESLAAVCENLDPTAKMWRIFPEQKGFLFPSPQQGGGIAVKSCLCMS